MYCKQITRQQEVHNFLMSSSQTANSVNFAFFEEIRKF